MIFRIKTSYFKNKKMTMSQTRDSIQKLNICTYKKKIIDFIYLLKQKFKQHHHKPNPIHNSQHPKSSLQTKTITSPKIPTPSTTDPQPLTESQLHHHTQTTHPVPECVDPAHTRSHRTHTRAPRPFSRTLTSPTHPRVRHCRTCVGACVHRKAW